MRERLINLIVLTIFLATMAGAAPMTGGGYSIPSLTISSGGSNNLSGGTYKMIDIKGQAAVGSMTGGTYGLGLGGIYGEVVSKEGGGAVGPAVGSSEAGLSDIGRIRNTNITRESIAPNDLKITWGYNELGPTAVNIYALYGAGQDYNSNPAVWPTTPLATVNSSTTYYIHSSVARDGNNYYYRVVPSPLVDPSILANANNSITVGKVDINMPANKYVFCGRPFMEDYYALSGILAEQIGTDGEFLWWDGSVYRGASYSGRWVGEDRMMKIGEGFIVRPMTAGHLALIGRFGTLVAPVIRNFDRNKYYLINYPYPKNQNFNNSGITPNPDDELLQWDLARQVFQGNSYSTALTWVGSPDVSGILVGDPRFYRPVNTINTWSIQAP